MVQAWYMDSNVEDRKAAHMTDPPRFVDTEKLKELTNVEYFKVNADDFKNDRTLQDLRKSRGYSYEDSIEISSQVENCEERGKKFYTEHLHADEEIRLIVAGCGYFDIRDRNDKWIRIEVKKDDLLVLPAGIYHRFTTDKKDFVQINRYFVGQPVWTAFNRPADDHPSRINYINKA